MSLGTLVTARLPGRAPLLALATAPVSDTATVAEYSPDGVLLSVR